jgi:CRP/FNR family cyclic AMP-dependent transcriptional regulator
VSARAPFPAQSFLGGLAPEELRAVDEAGFRREWKAKSFIFREGDESDCVFFLLGGTVRLVKTTGGGHEVLVELRRRGDVIGELGALSGAVRLASAATITRVTAIGVTSNNFERLRAEHAGIAERVLFTVVARLRVATERQLELGTVDAVGRVCRRISELAIAAGTNNEGMKVVRHVSQQDLANWAGVSRDGVVRALQDLRNRGWVQTGRQRIEVLDLEAISRRAEG